MNIKAVKRLKRTHLIMSQQQNTFT